MSYTQPGIISCLNYEHMCIAELKMQSLGNTIHHMYTRPSTSQGKAFNTAHLHTQEQKRVAASEKQCGKTMPGIT